MTPYTHSSRAMAPPSYKHNSNQHGYHSNRTTLTSLSEVPVLLLPDDNNKSNNRNSGRYSSSYSSSKGTGSRTVRISSSTWTGSSSSRSSQSRSSTSKKPAGKANRGQPRTKNIGRGRILIVSPEPRAAAAAAAEQPSGGPTAGAQGQKGPGWTCCRCGGVTSLRWLDCDNRQCRHYRCGSPPHVNKTDLSSSSSSSGQIVRVFLTRGNQTKTKTKTNGIAAAAGGGRTCHDSSRSSSLPKEYYYSDLGCVINKGPGVLKRMGLRLVRKLARHVPPPAGRRRASRCGCGVGQEVFRGC